ncbi:MAG: Spy/CpxP family protein refolding chaperone [Bacteroidota bacterium]
MKTSRIFTALLFVLSLTILSAQPAHERKMPNDLNLSDIQKEQFEKIEFDTQKKQIDLGAKLATLKLEMNRLMSADQMDKSAIEKKMNEIATQSIALRMNHLNAWSEKNKLLNADQQKIWKKKLLQRVRRMQNGNGEGMMHEKKMGRGMQRGMMNGHPGMMMEMDDEHPRMERRIEKEIIKQ